jgi:ribokinase
MIVVFGSLNMDIVIPVRTLPRPGETVLTASYLMAPGGKGMNQAVAAARVGAPVAMAGCVGSDIFGDRLLEVLAAEGVDASLVRRVPEPTGTAAVAVDAEGENAIVVASGANGVADDAAVPDARLGPGTTVVMQMEVPHEANWRLLARARAAGARTLLSLAPAAPIPADALDALSVLVLNRVEIGDLARQLGMGDAAPARLARGLASAHGTTIVVTLGADGALAAEPDGTLWTAPPLPVRPVDTTGAGDCFSGILAASLDAGHALPEALRRAGAGAALSCLALGAQAALPRAADVEARLAEAPTPRRS